jgi:hypothetical protein
VSTMALAISFWKLFLFYNGFYKLGQHFNWRLTSLIHSKLYTDNLVHEISRPIIKFLSFWWAAHAHIMSFVPIWSFLSFCASLTLMTSHDIIMKVPATFDPPVIGVVPIFYSQYCTWLLLHISTYLLSFYNPYMKNEAIQGLKQNATQFMYLYSRLPWHS